MTHIMRIDEMSDGIKKSEITFEELISMTDNFTVRCSLRSRYDFVIKRDFLFDIVRKNGNTIDATIEEMDSIEGETKKMGVRYKKDVKMTFDETEMSISANVVLADILKDFDNEFFRKNELISIDIIVGDDVF